VAGPEGDLIAKLRIAAPPLRGPVRWLGFEAATPARNMAIDRALLRAGASPAIRLYAWSPPGVSLGWFQRDVDLEPFRRAGYDVVRRLTGGGAVVHHHEVTYAMLLPTSHAAIDGRATVETYAAIHQPIREALAAAGIETEGRAPVTATRSAEPALCFERASPLDVLWAGRKIVGSAQRRLPDRLLQHGSIILAPNPLQPDQPALIGSDGKPVDPTRLVVLLRAAFERAFGPLEDGGLSTAEEEAASADRDGVL
jgi:lipoyl(octanoyl) transferase